MTRTLSLTLASLALVLLLARPAGAQVSVDGGYFDAGGNSSIGAALSLQLFKTPVVPWTVEATAASPLDGHGYAATLDGRFKISGTTVGAGVGIGNLGNNPDTGVQYEGIIAQSLLPHVSVEARVYFGNSRPASVFAGLRLTL